MPYVSSEVRARLDAGADPITAGDLNYLITRLVTRYTSRAGVKYSSINEAIGVLECAKLELYRRIAAPYEDGKCKSNGDVY